MQRSQSFSVRVSPEERHVLALIAAHFDRSESDTVRRLIRDVGRALGVVPPLNTRYPQREGMIESPRH